MAIVRCYACDGWFDPTDGEYDDDTLEFWCQDCLFTREAEEEANKDGAEIEAHTIYGPKSFSPLDKD